MDIDELERLTELIYESATDPAGWDLVVSALGRLFGDAAVVLDCHATSGGENPFYSSARFDTSLRDVHFEEYRTPHDNPAAAALLTRRIGEPFTLESFVDTKTYDSDPSIRAILHPQRFDKVMLVPLERADGTLSFMNIFRTASQPDFDTENTKVFGFVAKQVIRALRQRQLALRYRRRQAIVRERSQSGWTTEGVIIVDNHGRIVDADAAALAILDVTGGLVLRHGRLFPVSRGPGQNVADLDEFLRSGNFDSRPFVVRGSKGTIFIICVAGSACQSGGDSPYRRYVTIRRVDSHGAVQVAALGSAFGLTAGELRALEAICKTATTTQAAQSLGIGRETMKTHLGNIYAKTECSSMAELMRLVGRFQ